MREDEKGFYEPLTMDEAVRYGVYRRTRFGVLTFRVWHWWREPTGEVLPFHAGPDYYPWDADKYGLWLNSFQYPEAKWERYRQYYRKRMPWRRWSLSSARCHAARNGYRVRHEE